MGFEIERKFLVTSDAWRAQANKHMHLRQAYLASDGRASIRVRIADNREATLTIKSRSAEMRRLELEYSIPVIEAEAMIPLRLASVIEKVRSEVPFGGLVWEIDVFSGENEGLIIAEVELSDEHQHVEMPPWIGAEVTRQANYYNGALAQRPFATWAKLQSQVQR